jgi:uncharacterized membrane protein HdeD (DUF308 family)
MAPREAAGWGLVGALSFLVLAFGYLLAVDPGVSLPAIAGVAVVVGVASGLASAWLRRRIDRGVANESP